jgi:hypothetical protein
MAKKMASDHPARSPCPDMKTFLISGWSVVAGIARRVMMLVAISFVLSGIS